METSRPMMIFTGPTLSVAEGRAILPQATFLPPVAQGDVYRVALDRPLAIGIIDGYFERVPSVWHKEILWAMSEGIPVFGASSMGALRAAECAPFGMVGVGAIFEAFRDGLLEDDDEVTVIHGPEESGYFAGSEAMVNIRATLARALQEGVLDAPSRDVLEGAAKGLFYQKRAWPTVLEEAHRLGVDASRLEALRQWLPVGRVDQKKEDARAMLQAMARHAQEGSWPPRVPFFFEHTSMWEQATRGLSREQTVRTDEDLPLERVLDEVRLQGLEAWQRFSRDALLRALALEEAKRRDIQPTRVLVEQAFEHFREERGLETVEALRRWWESQGLSEADFHALMSEEALVQQVMRLHAADVRRQARQVLRLEGRYGALKHRAEQAQAGHLWPEEMAEGEEEELLRRYFEERLGQEIPRPLESYGRRLGLSSASELVGLIRRTGKDE